MAMDPLEKDRLRRQMATRMHLILGGGASVECVGAHYQDEPVVCDLCLDAHATELFVIRNRAHKKFHVAAACLREMVRFQVGDVVDMGKWLEKMKEIKLDHEKRKRDEDLLRLEERRRLEKKVIVRRRESHAN